MTSGVLTLVSALVSAVTGLPPKLVSGSTGSLASALRAMQA